MLKQNEQLRDSFTGVLADPAGLRSSPSGGGINLRMSCLVDMDNPSSHSPLLLTAVSNELAFSRTRWASSGSRNPPAAEPISETVTSTGRP